jgi:hypothetical protein
LAGSQKVESELKQLSLIASDTHPNIALDIRTISHQEQVQRIENNLRLQVTTLDYTSKTNSSPSTVQLIWFLAFEPKHN